MSLMAGQALREFRKENRRKIGDRGIFTLNPRHKKSSRSHGDDTAYLKFLKEEDALRYRQIRKSDHQRAVMVLIFSLLPFLIFLLGYWLRY